MLLVLADSHLQHALTQLTRHSRLAGHKGLNTLVVQNRTTVSEIVKTLKRENFQGDMKV